MEDALERLGAFRRRSRLGGGEERVRAQRAKGKLTARERLELLLDPASFVESDRFAQPMSARGGMDGDAPLGDGVVTGHGMIEGRLAHVFSQDFTVMGGSLGEAHAAKIVKVQERALKTGAPIIGLNDSGGARIQEGVVSLAGYADIFLRNTLASGVVPQISVILGPCAGGAVYSPAITDFVFMVRGGSYMFVTGPEVVEEVTREEIDMEGLGGADAHAERSGVAHFAMDDEAACLKGVRRLLRYLPSNCRETPPERDARGAPGGPDSAFRDIVPDDPGKPYDILEIIQRVADDGEFLETHAGFARNLVTGFFHLGGRPTGVVANQPKVLAGVLDIDASDKGARFVRFCDAFNIPLVVFEDVPGFLPGVDQEHGGIIRHGAKLLYAFAEATVPKVTVIVRKAYGGAYDVMSSKHIRGDVNLAWPIAEIAVMGARAAARILHRRELESARDPKAVLDARVREYRARYAHPYIAAGRGYVDDVIDPANTRSALLDALAMLANKRDRNPPRKHGNIPL